MISENNSSLLLFFFFSNFSFHVIIYSKVPRVCRRRRRRTLPRRSIDILSSLVSGVGAYTASSSIYLGQITRIIIHTLTRTYAHSAEYAVR